MAKVLVVADAEIDRRLAGGCVEESGGRAIYAGSGQEALALIEQQRPDVVLTDLQMPEMDGLELVKTLRRDYSGLPVILMTAWGSEEIAVAALRAGAASYVPKKRLRRDLAFALDTVLAAVGTARQRVRVRQLLRHAGAEFVLGPERDGRQILASHLQGELAQLDFCDDSELTQIGMALIEALANAVDHGNLELDSALRESGSQTYWELASKRSEEPPYGDRRVHVTTKLTQDEALYVVRDEGPGFDVSKLPDPTKPENLIKSSGRGVMLIRTFMDEVSFNDEGNEITMLKRRTNST